MQLRPEGCSNRRSAFDPAGPDELGTAVHGKVSFTTAFPCLPLTRACHLSHRCLPPWNPWHDYRPGVSAWWKRLHLAPASGPYFGGLISATTSSSCRLRALPVASLTTEEYPGPNASLPVDQCLKFTSNAPQAQDCVQCLEFEFFLRQKLAGS